MRRMTNAKQRRGRARAGAIVAGAVLATALVPAPGRASDNELLCHAPPRAAASAASVAPELDPAADDCLPTPAECATGRFNGRWATAAGDRFAICQGYFDADASMGHIVHYAGGEVVGDVPGDGVLPNNACGVVIVNDRTVQTNAPHYDPNGCYGPSVPAGYGAPGRAYVSGRNRAVTGAAGVVASTSELASKAGLEVLDAGGNAIDAAIATVFAVGVTRPEMCGIGGGGFLVYRTAAGDVAALDFRETAPAAIQSDTFKKAGFDPTATATGHLPVGVPGLVAGMDQARVRLGTGKSLAELVEPARELAVQGVPISNGLAAGLYRHASRLGRHAEAKRVFLDAEGKAPLPSPISPPLRFPDLASSLAAIQEQGPAAFYGRDGTIARKIVEEMERYPATASRTDYGLITAADLESYRPVWRTPLQGSYRGAKVITMGAPSAGGVFVLEALNVLEGFDVGALKHSSADHLHLMAEVQKLAWSDRDYVEDPAFSPTPPELTSKGYAARRRGEISLTKAGRYQPGLDTHGRKPTSTMGGSETTHVSVIDEEGNAAAVTCSIGGAFGSAVVAPGTGFILNETISGFSWPSDDGSPLANTPAPGKRPQTANTPTIVVQRGRPVLVTGAMGGKRIPVAVAMTVSNLIDFGMPPDQAVDVARIDAPAEDGSSNDCLCIALEDLRIPVAEHDALLARGHQLRPPSFDHSTPFGTGGYKGEYEGFGAVLQSAGVDASGRRWAFSDPRAERGSLAQR